MERGVWDWAAAEIELVRKKMDDTIEYDILVLFQRNLSNLDR
jgi:hypothetical protein